MFSTYKSQVSGFDRFRQFSELPRRKDDFVQAGRCRFLRNATGVANDERTSLHQAQEVRVPQRREEKNVPGASQFSHETEFSQPLGRPWMTWEDDGNRKAQQDLHEFREAQRIVNDLGSMGSNEGEFLEWHMIEDCGVAR